MAFLTSVLRPVGEFRPRQWRDLPSEPLILRVSQSTVTSDLNGLASVAPSGGAFSPPIEVDVAITAGGAAHSTIRSNFFLPYLANRPERGRHQRKVANA